MVFISPGSSMWGCTLCPPLGLPGDWIAGTGPSVQVGLVSICWREEGPASTFGVQLECLFVKVYL